MKLKILLALAAALTTETAMAIPADTTLLITRHLPDGTTITYRQNGDEHFHYTTLKDGSLVMEQSDGCFYHAIVTDTDIKPTTYKVGSPLPSNMFRMSDTKTPSVEARLQKLQAQKQNRHVLRQAVNTTAAQRGLVILVNFANTAMTHKPQEFYDMLNKEGYDSYGATGSARDYFLDSSYGKYAPEFDVLGPYTLSKNASYYGGNNSYGEDRHPDEMVLEACQLAYADGHDLSVYDADKDGVIDNVYVFYAGEGEATGGAASTIWPHRWVVYPDNVGGDATVGGLTVYDYACSNELMPSYKQATGTDLTGIGTFVHEFGHVLGLPDLYATNGRTHRTLEGYDVMCSGSYLNYMRTPVSYSAYERMFMGWATPTQIFPTGDEMRLTVRPNSIGNFYLITADGTQHNMDGRNPQPSEFYLIENKPGTGWDTFASYRQSNSSTDTADKGMLVTRIRYSAETWDDNTVNNNYYSMGVAYVYTTAQEGFSILK